MFVADGIRIISFNHFLMGPVGLQHLADMGADVISLESVNGAFQRRWGGTGKTVDGQTMLQLVGNRNKRSVAVDIKSERGLEIARKLIRSADVVAENFRPGVMEKLGLGYEDVRAIKPDIVYASATGFGSTGPYVDRPGQDLIIQAMSGLAKITGSKSDGPRAIGVSAVDHHGAALYAMAILAALLRRERTGAGGRVDVSLLSAAMDLQQESFVCYMNAAEASTDVSQSGRIAGWYFPAPYGIYATSNGYMALSLSPLSDIYDALGVPIGDRIPEEFAHQKSDQISELLASHMRRYETEQLVSEFEQRGIWFSPVNDYPAVLDDPQVRHMRSVITMNGATGKPIRLVNHPVRYDGAAPEMRLPPQMLGAQTREVLDELGYRRQEIDLLLKDGVVASA